MRNASTAHKETNERLELLKAEGAYLLMALNSGRSAEHARLRMIDEKIKSLSGQLRPQRYVSSR
jgi:hypothetical protein